MNIGKPSWESAMQKYDPTLKNKSLYQVWDWEKNEVHSFHSGKMSADETAKLLNANTTMDWNGLPRYQAMEAND